MPKFLRPYFRQFLDGDGGANGGDPTPQTQPTPQPQGKVFSEDYVSQLREEAKSYRLRNRELEKTIKTSLGLNADADISDFSKAFNDFKTNSEKATSELVQKANNRLIAAEIKSKTDYDSKLLERLLDKSKLTVGEDGTISGLDEQIAELEKDFPMIKVNSVGTGSTGANPGGGNYKSEEQLLNEQLEEAKKNKNVPMMVSLTNKLYQLKNKL